MVYFFFNSLFVWRNVEVCLCVVWRYNTVKQTRVGRVESLFQRALENILVICLFLCFPLPLLVLHFPFPSEITVMKKRKILNLI